MKKSRKAQMTTQVNFLYTTGQYSRVTFKKLGSESEVNTLFTSCKSSQFTTSYIQVYSTDLKIIIIVFLSLSFHSLEKKNNSSTANQWLNLTFKKQSFNSNTYVILCFFKLLLKSDIHPTSRRYSEYTINFSSSF